MIQDLLENVNIEREQKFAQSIETCKLKKALTIRDTESMINFSKEELSRYQQKLQNQEKSIVDQSLEIEKLKRNIDYYKNLIVSRNEIISKLECQLNSLSKEETFRNEYIDHIKNIFKNFLQCQSCKIGITTVLISPCFHLFCSECEPKENSCIVCHQDVNEINAFKYYNTIREIVLSLESININNE